MKPKVSVVIVNYNVKDLLLTCLRTLYHLHTQINIEVIVVDNQSVDGSIDAIQEAFPQVILIANNFNAGFPKANNQGFEIAQGEYVFMLNPDTEFQENSIELLAQFLDNHPDVVALGPKLLNTDGSFQNSVWRYPTVFSVFCESFYLSRFLNKKNYRDQDKSKSFEAESFSGAAIFFRKDVLDKVGNLDETMFWIEDVEFCFRINAAKMKALFFPETAILHHIGQSAKKNYNISLSNQVFNKIKFFKKHRSFLAWMCIVAISFVHVLYKIALFGILSPFNPIYYRKCKAYLYTLPKVFNPPKGIA